MKNFKSLEDNDAFAKVGKKAAFTLAEVLITIGIVGIVAGMTIPTIAHKIRNKILEIQFKHSYAEVTQAIKRMQADMDMTGLGLIVHIGAVPLMSIVRSVFLHLEKLILTIQKL
jgi:prepilin-type N-terminal cleavage/methylation domain-containing protein